MSRSKKSKPRPGTRAAPRSEPDATGGESPPPGWFASRWPIIKAVAIFAGVMAMFYVAQYYYTNRIDWYLEGIAATCSWVLDLFGQDTTASGTAIVSQAFSVRIVHGCDALEPTAAFVAAVLASPVSFLRKVPGLAIGIAALLVINLFRIITLYFVGVHWKEAFEMMHVEFWQAVFIVLAIVFWAVWVQWATRKRTVVNDA